MEVVGFGGASNDAENVEEIFSEMKERIGSNDTAAVKRCVRKLDEASATPQFALDILAPHLFRGASHNAKLSPRDALSILGVLVSLNSPRYLKPASRAVKIEAVRLTTSEHPMVVPHELTGVMISQLSGNDVEVAANAADSMVACCRKLGPAFADPAMRVMAETWRGSLERMGSDRTVASTVAVRCASAMVEMVSLDDAIMRSAAACGSTDLLLTMLVDDTDPLLQMSALDLIEKASTLPMHGERARWLFSDRILDPLLGMAGGSEEEGSPNPILGGPALRVVAALCRLGQRDPSLFGSTDSDRLLRGFHRSLHNFEQSGELDRLALIGAISSFASASPDALELVLADPVTREAWLSLSVAQPKLKSAVLCSVAMVLDPVAEVDANGDTVAPRAPSNALGMELYETLGSANGGRSTELVLSLARSPLPETRLGAYALLKAVAKLPTGGQVLFSHGDFYSFLISRDGEKTKEGREAKHLLVETVVESEVKGLLANEVVRKLQKYVEEGPHYVETRNWELATD